MQCHGSALVGHQTPCRSRLAPLSHLGRSALSLALSLARSTSGSAAMRHRHRGLELPLLATLTPSSEFEATGDLVSPPRTSRVCSTPLGKPCSATRAHRSEPELRRTLGSRGSLLPPPLASIPSALVLP